MRTLGTHTQDWGGYRIETETYEDNSGVRREREVSRTPLRRVEGPVVGDAFLSVLAHIWLYTMIFLFLAWGVVSLVGGIGFLVLLVGGPILYVSISERMAGVRRFLRWAATGVWRGLVATVRFLKDVAWEIREWVADRV